MTFAPKPTHAALLTLALTLNLQACSQGDSDEPQTNEQSLDCTTSPAHTRCSASPATYDQWHAASVVNKIELVADDTCCFDLTGDGKNNNALGELLKLAASFDVNIEGFNQNIKESIDDGSLVLLVEHQYIKPEGGPFSINYYLGDADGGFTTPAAQGSNPYKIDRETFSQGVWPSARMSQATHDGSALAAGPGTVNITTALLGPPITLNITAAQIDAKLDAARSSFEPGQAGVALVNGRLGGAVRVSELFDAINDVYANQCGCAPISGGAPFIGYDVDNLSKAACSAPMNDTSACNPDDQAQGLCISVYNLCKLVGFAQRVADVDADSPQGDCRANRSCNAISLATTFEAVGAKITGVSAQ